MYLINQHIGTGNGTRVALQSENFVCEEGNAATIHESHINDPVQYMKPSSSDGENIVTSGHDSSPDRLFNNPIYGSSGMKCLLHYHKFDDDLGHGTNVTPQSENSVHEEPNIAIEQESHIGYPVQYMKPSYYSDGDKVVVSGHDSSPERLFNNPIYGCSEKELENIYAHPDTEDQPGTGNRMESLPHYHKFDNPIYDFDEAENAYSTIATVGSTALFKSGVQAIDHEAEQVYDYVN